jgi:hypothetical protein
MCAVAAPEKGSRPLDGGQIDDFGTEGSPSKINYDNSYHLKYRVRQSGMAEFQDDFRRAAARPLRRRCWR